jgi:hypothetical protein
MMLQGGGEREQQEGSGEGESGPGGNGSQVRMTWQMGWWVGCPDDPCYGAAGHRGAAAGGVR